MATVASMPSYFPMHWFPIHQLHQATSWAQKFFLLPKTSNQWFDGSTDAKDMMSCKWWALWCRFLLLGRETLLAGKLHCGVLHHSTALLPLHHGSAVQCDSNVKWSGMCYNWASCDHMYDCRAFIIEYQELCVGQCWVDCKALVGCTRVAGWVEGRAGSELLPALTWTVTIKLSHK